MENLQKKPLYEMEDGADESAVELLPKLKNVLSGLMVGKAGGLRKIPFLTIKVSGCWNWNNAKCGKGYGRMSLEGKQVLVHRFMYKQ